MKLCYKVLSVLLVLMCAHHVHAQEQWDTYMGRYGTRPGSVLVDMALVKDAPDKLLPYLVITGPHARECNSPQGIPSPKEIDELEKVLDVTGSMLSGATAKKLAGTFTRDCERLNYYYVRDTVAIRGALHRMYTNYFQDYAFTLKIKPDPDWLVYRSFLYPDSAAQEWMAVNKTISSMLRAGDDLSRPRDILYTLYFLTETNRAAFADSATAHRFTINDMKTTQGFSQLYEITVVRHAPVMMDSVLADQALLKDLAAPLRGNYRNWDAIPAPTDK